jgi:hypothetical protein
MPPDGRRARIPARVVHRDFPNETVVLNLETGQYHGLNVTAGRMLAALDQAGSIPAAASVVATEFGVSRVRVERDLHDFCRRLADRGILELDGAEAD